MRIDSSYPVLMVPDVAAAGEFFVHHFGFAVSFSSDWYVSLRHPEPPHAELAFLRPDHPTIPGGRGRPAAGVLVNFEVADAAAAWERFRASDVPVLLPIRDEDFGQRHFILDGPGGVLVDVIQNIAPSAEYAAAYR
ncbi:VOC family protein [Roseisolibacter sp. H3M3-2]|uniref:VOC family protein n=1 Tax=Roseisolibacter sp. H3M3-2 TaxID=3031323 RepID=UPI0023DBE963|nr:VOC family protein [Roseisolibacter sp. H3M3-2]MDF1505037.1 VOC family protein [Roseisolibacter sp. H3M3-2]